MVTTGRSMETNLIAEAVKFMILGMGVVFSFLIIMVYALKVQAKLVNKYCPEKKIEPSNQLKSITNEASNNSTKIAAIVAAVQHHKNLKG
jgi:oxaloacetate decarboxylase (Na+ extruding) subunit gamma